MNQIRESSCKICVKPGTSSEFDLSSRYDGRERANLLNGPLIQRSVDLNHRHRFPAPLAAAEMKPANVDAAVSQNGSDAANHTGDVAIMHDQHVTAGNRFDMKAVDFSDAALARFAAV